MCVQAGTGQLVDLADRDLRPPPTPTGLRDSLLAMILGDLECDDVGWREEPRHDPSDRLRDYIRLRDRFCDGPTSARVTATRADLDHDDPWPAGPTAAWNLTARGRRTHQHKHHGWTPLRTATSTLWLSPAGQLVEVPRHTSPPPGTTTGTRRPTPRPRRAPPARPAPAHHQRRQPTLAARHRTRPHPVADPRRQRTPALLVGGLGLRHHASGSSTAAACRAGAATQ